MVLKDAIDTEGIHGWLLSKSASFGTAIEQTITDPVRKPAASIDLVLAIHQADYRNAWVLFVEQK